MLCSEGLHKGVSSTILQLPKGISSTILLQNHNMSKENVFLDPTVLPCKSERDKKWDPGIPSFIPVFQPMDGNTSSKSSHIPIGNQKHRLLIGWQ